MMASGDLDISIRVATVVVPPAMYFLILGLLNTRRTPQILAGRLDFALLITAMAPLFVLPVLHMLGISQASIVAACGVVACGILVLAPRGRTWVVYNASSQEADRAVAEALRAGGYSWKKTGSTFNISDGRETISLTPFPLLRNVSVQFDGCDEAGARFGRELARALADVPAEPQASAVALLVVAMTMMVAPLAMMANQAGEIVRLVTDLLN